MKSHNGKNQENTPQATINLGLSAILEAHNGNGQAREVQQLSSTEEPKSEIPTAETARLAQVSLTPLAIAMQMADARRWNELAEYVEALLAKDPELSQMRVLWVLAQFKLKRMPLGILAGPLDSASKRMLDSFGRRAEDAELASEKRLLLSALHQIGKELLQQGESALALVFLERAHSLSAEVGDDLSLCVDANLKRLGERRGKRNEEADNRDRERLAELKNKLRKEQVASQIAPQLGNAKRKKVSFAPRSLAIAGVCSALALLTYYLLTREPYQLLPAKIALGLSLPGIEQPILREPQLSPLGSLGNLDGVLYQLEHKNAPVALRADSSEELARQTAAQTTNQAPVAKEVIDTSSPLKERPGLRTTDLSASRVASSESGSRNRFARNDQRESELAQRADMRLVEIENFPVPLAYELVQRAWVMSKPSAWAAQISELAPGERVWVVAKVGDWYKLRSKEGTRIGYIRGSSLRNLSAN